MILERKWEMTHAASSDPAIKEGSQVAHMYSRLDFVFDVVDPEKCSSCRMCRSKFQTVLPSVHPQPKTVEIVTNFMPR